MTQPILETLGRVGGQVTDVELAYQLGETLDLEAMADLEGRGLVRSHLVFELTGRGREVLGAVLSTEVVLAKSAVSRGAALAASPRAPKRARKRAKTGKTRVGSTLADAS